jgi:DNA-binding winged helix-turn-helix (wHTH) protein/tetratricopeptide (TPR) repeat protein
LGDGAPMIEGISSKPPETRIDLAGAPDFELGSLRVRPPRRQLVLPDGTVRELEPRVMQVLVALAEARPEVVSRDRLIELCWDGRIVGDDAINRCILALRHLARELEPPPFTIETFPRVGYALVEQKQTAETSQQAPSVRPIVTRRALAGFAAGGLLMVAGAAYLFGSRSGRPANAEALSWYEKGVAAREQGLVELYPQVQANFREAVQADPDFADGWSALAVAYLLSTFIERDDQQVAFAQRTRSAALRALRLDPRSLEAQAALALIPSDFQRWAEQQDHLNRLLKGRPAGEYLHWLLHRLLANSLNACGRCVDALAASRMSVELQPQNPATWSNHLFCLWAAGELAEAEMESEKAVERWPAHAELWLFRMALLTYSSQPAAALSFGEQGMRPLYVDLDGLVERRLATARALASNNSADVERAVRMHLDRIVSHPEDMMPATRFFAALGRLDTVFQICEAYYFNKGPLAVPGRRPHNALTRLDTISLFWPPMAPAWRDPRFQALTEQIGLARYWRETDTVPDFRRAPLT